MISVLQKLPIRLFCDISLILNLFRSAAGLLWHGTRNLDTLLTFYRAYVVASILMIPKFVYDGQMVGALMYGLLLTLSVLRIWELFSKNRNNRSK